VLENVVLDQSVGGHIGLDSVALRSVILRAVEVAVADNNCRTDISNVVAIGVDGLDIFDPALEHIKEVDPSFAVRAGVVIDRHVFDTDARQHRTRPPCPGALARLQFVL